MGQLGPSYRAQNGADGVMMLQEPLGKADIAHTWIAWDWLEWAISRA